MEQPGIKMGVLFLGRKRPGFDPEWGKTVKMAIRTFLDSHKYEYIAPSDSISDDAGLRSALDACRQAGAKTLLVTQPTISDGRLAPLLAQAWSGPIVFWATTEKKTSESVSSGSLVGAHIFASFFRQLGHSFELVYGHPEDGDTKEQLDLALRIIAATVKLETAKVGLIGQHAPGYFNIAVDPVRLSESFGIHLHHLSLHEFLPILGSVSDQEAADDVSAFRKMHIPLKDVAPEDLTLASRFYVAFTKIMKDEHLDALAVRCWPELPDITGQWPYVAMSRMISEGSAVAEEGDVDGAVSALVAETLGMGHVYMSDWHEHDRSTISIWHTGVVPFDLCEPIGSEAGPHVAKHFNIRKPAVIEATVKSDLAVTVFRLWGCDGEYRLMALEGKTIPPRQHLLGNNGLVEIGGTDVRDLFDELVHEGLPHHVMVAGGHHRRMLKRFARATGIRWSELN